MSITNPIILKSSSAGINFHKCRIYDTNNILLIKIVMWLIISLEAIQSSNEPE